MPGGRRPNLDSDKLAVGYLRVSGLSQVDMGGFPRQREAIEKFCIGAGFQIVRWYQEEAVPGKTELENRPALWQLRQDLLNDGIRTVVIEKMDRLARDLMVSESIIADFGRHQISIVSTLEPDLCSTDPTRVLIRQILGAFAQYERSMIVAKLNAGRQRIRSQGLPCEGRKKYGCHPKHPGEASTIALVKTMQAKEGLSATQIALRLNRQGIPTRSGGRWYPQQVIRMLD